MASSSSFSVQNSFKYDVFLSFRGEDTRKSFVDHLYHALQQRGIITYKDDIRIEKGENISDQLIRSIQGSRFHIIVFSKNYASSSWCLEELVNIMECHNSNKQNAYPIFYDVEPTEVRNQTGAVGEAFTKHVKKVGARRWRDALKEAANLAGWELKNTCDGHEVQFIQKVVDDISRKPYFSNFGFNDKLVGMKTRVEEVLSSLECGSSDVRMIGIKGIGGGGKTTLARAIFDHISTLFEGKSFIENVRECSKGGFGLKGLQNQILHDVTKDDSIYVESVFDGEYKIKRYLGSRKVLVVLDDVDHMSQLEALAGEPTWFKAGSVIIITTRDKHVLVAHHVNFIHDINLLSPAEAISLFSRHAFKGEYPSQGFEELSKKVVHYAAGLPLTIKVLGSFLCQRTKHEWEKIIERLKKIPLKETLEKLELSYNGLENDYREIFLDVVCMLKGEGRDEALAILERCGYDAEIGLTVLEEKCLISISHGGFLQLHDHIEEMGRNIIRRLHPEEPSKHSRLWIKEEIEGILVDDSGTEAIKLIKLDYTNLHPHIIIKGLRKMKTLRFLQVYHVRGYIKETNGLPRHLPNSLKCLYWYRYPFRCLPKTFQASKLVNLEMQRSNISQLWEGEETKVLNSLRYLNLAGSRKLRTLDLGLTPNLEQLFLEDCVDFVELIIPTVCPKLEILDLTRSKVCKLNLTQTPNLEKLVLEDCGEFVELVIPTVCPKFGKLYLTRSKVSKLNLEKAPNLSQLHLTGNFELVELEMPAECVKLESFHLSFSKVRKLWILHAPHLRSLSLGSYNNNLQEIAVPEGCLEHVKDRLYLSGWSRFDIFRETPVGLPLATNLEVIERSIYTCPLHPTNMMPHFQYKYSFDGVVGNTEKILYLRKCVCTNIDIGPQASFTSLIDMKLLSFLISGKVPEELCQLNTLERLKLTMREVKHLPDSICMLNNLKSLELSSCSRLEQLPKDLDRLVCLEELIITGCGELRTIPDSICNMKSLKRLHLLDCSGFGPKLPAELGRLECLEELNVQGTDLPYLPRCIYQLKGLRIVGSKLQLVSYGVTIFLSSEISESSAFGYIKDPPLAELQPWVGKKRALIQQGQSSTVEDSSRPMKILRS